MTEHELATQVADELVSARKKFHAFNSPHEGYGVILEELDELWDEVRRDKLPGAKERMRKEAIQVAAMAMRFALDVCDEDPSRAALGGEGET